MTYGVIDFNFKTELHFNDTIHLISHNSCEQCASVGGLAEYF